MVMGVTQGTFYVCVFCNIEFRDTPNGVNNPSAAQNLTDHMNAHHSEKWRLLTSGIQRFGIPQTAVLTRADAEAIVDRENQYLFDHQMVKQEMASQYERQRRENAAEIAKQMVGTEGKFVSAENQKETEFFSRLAELERENAELRAELDARRSAGDAEKAEALREAAASREEATKNINQEIAKAVEAGEVSPDLEGSEPDRPSGEEAPEPPKPPVNETPPDQRQGGRRRG